MARAHGIRFVKACMFGKSLRVLRDAEDLDFSKMEMLLWVFLGNMEWLLLF